MPYAPPRPCPQCKQVGCTQHIRPAWGHAVKLPRIRGRQLQKLREQLWVAQGGRCTACQKPGVLKDMVRDHIINMQEGGTEDVGNTQLLCRACSDAKTKAEAIRGMHRTGGA